jgi:hypothetical protein
VGDEAALVPPGSGGAAGAPPLECLGGTTQCGDECVDVDLDPNNCGECGKACAAGEDCTGGNCCPFGQTYCGGACTNVSVDPEHCGDCARACGMSEPLCIDGECKPPLPSCLAQLTNDPTAASGVYPLDPDGSGAAQSFSAYCDMTTDGGGWTLVLAYAHMGGQNNDLVAGAAPVDPMLGYGHASLTVLQQIPATEIRLYCETSGHARKVHFKTASGAVNYFRGETGNSVIHWSDGFTALAGHTANLPAATGSAYNQMGEDRMTEFPFYLGNTYHWGIRGSGTRWECDDHPNGPANTTLHQVWVR